MTILDSAVRVALVTNIPTPYRMPVYEALATDQQIELKVYFCSGREPDRKWDLGKAAFDQVYLRERFFSISGRFIHVNPDVWTALRLFKPDVVITTGFNPTHLIAFLYARTHGAQHIAMTDGTFESEAKLSSMHRWVRRRVYAGSRSFIGASDGAFELYRSYGIDGQRILKSHLCANNALFLNVPPVEKRFDLIFCGRFVAIKSPLFALEIAQQVALRLGRRVSIIFVGSGEMEDEMRTVANRIKDQVETVFAGFARQEDLPKLYGSARIFLFPTQWDPWGVVANEACAAGLPVLVTPVAGSAAELIRNGENGFVMPLAVQQWADATVRLLSDNALYGAMAAKSKELVHEYNYNNAALGIAHAIRMSVDSTVPRRVSAGRRPRVVIIQRRMTHYRIPLFNLLRAKLDQVGIDLLVVFGDPTREELDKNDSGVLPWGEYVPCRYWLNGRLCWQNANGTVRNAALVIATQENRLIFNYFLGLFRRPHTLAFWGHGRNFQAKNANSLSERFKRRLVAKADWWFAYTEISARVLIDDAHFPKQRVTVLNNAIDAGALAEELASISDAEVQQARVSFGIAPGTIGILIASLHADKKLDFLIEAAIKLRQVIPHFQLVIVGDGPSRALVQQAVEKSEGGILWLGSRKGRDKALLLRIANVMLNPGMVGLGILDSFTAKLPMVTTAADNHSPEIAYLVNGVNGLMTPNNVSAYVNVVCQVLQDKKLYERLQEGCERSAEDVTLENMATRFSDGIQNCLKQTTEKNDSVKQQYLGASHE